MCTASAAQLLFSFFLPNNFFLSVRFRNAFPCLHLHTAQSRCRDLNPGPLPYQGSALPLSYTGIPCFFSAGFQSVCRCGIPSHQKPFFGKPTTKVAINYRYNNNSDRKLFTDSLFASYFLLSFAFSICFLSASMLVSTASSNDAAVFSANRSFPGIPKRMEANLSFPSLLFTSFKTTSA